ncbi:MAG TPA: sigma-70 family RNA polymerase sigma factor [Thermoanaerobaculia bacterium]
MSIEAILPAETAGLEAERIAQGLRQRDLALLNQLVDRYQGRLVRYLIHLLGRQEHVEDLVQETWLRVLERGRQYDCRWRFEAWLFTIARNLTLDLLRKKQNPSLADLPETGTEAVPPSPVEPSPFEAAARSEDAARLASALTALEPIYREALLLRFQEDMSLQEIANIVQAPVSTVSSRIYRGLAVLRAHLETEGNADDGRSE